MYFFLLLQSLLTPWLCLNRPGQSTRQVLPADREHTLRRPGLVWVQGADAGAAVRHLSQWQLGASNCEWWVWHMTFAATWRAAPHLEVWMWDFCTLVFWAGLVSILGHSFLTVLWRENLAITLSGRKPNVCKHSWDFPKWEYCCLHLVAQVFLTRHIVRHGAGCCGNRHTSGSPVTILLVMAH